MKPKILIGVLIILAALIFLVYSGIKDTGMYYLTVSELKAQEHSFANAGVRMSGDVVTGSINYNANELKLGFLLHEGSDTVKVFHNGIKPDQLEEEQQVVVEGRLDSSGTFLASKILTKCPSKYESKKQNE